MSKHQSTIATYDAVINQMRQAVAPLPEVA
jgi:hypothetical protein